MVRSKVVQAILPILYWVGVLLTATYMLNHVPSKSVHSTPYELWVNKEPKLRTCLVYVFCHSISVIRHSSLITLKYHVCLALSLTFHHSIFLTLFVSSIPVSRCSFFFFSSVPKLTEPSEKKKKKKKKKKPRTDRTSERRRKKK